MLFLFIEHYERGWTHWLDARTSTVCLTLSAIGLFLVGISTSTSAVIVSHFSLPCTSLFLSDQNVDSIDTQLHAFFYPLGPENT
jgi:hypothetical protein